MQAARGFVNKVTGASSSANNGKPQDASTAASATIKVSDVKLAKDKLKVIPSKDRMKKLAGGSFIDDGGVSSFGAANDDMLIQDCHKHGFIGAVTSAFKDHRPLSLRPQHIWLLVLQAVATHVNENSEALRSKWVLHAGQKNLNVKCDEFSKGSVNNWASVVNGKEDCFTAQIKDNTIDGVMGRLLPEFSSTSPVENIAMQITVMDICKKYFSYSCSTMCGFPSITLEGTLDDWILLESKAEELVAANCTKEFAQLWLPALLPLLRKFHEQYLVAATGKGGSLFSSSPIDAAFWNSMCKLGGTSGSGSRTWFNGWFNIFFPYLENGRPNRFCVPYSASAGYVKEGLVWNKRYCGFSEAIPDGVTGPDVQDFPNGLGTAPVIWNYLDEKIELEFVAGFVGAKQGGLEGKDERTLSPHVGWYIAKKPADKGRGRFPDGYDY